MSLFPDDPADELPPQAKRLAPRLHELAAQGVYFGTSSWKYEGWLGSIYNPERYQTRGKVSKAKFEEGCLSEYAETFPTVCGDFAFYQFPSVSYWERLFAAVPAGFVFGFKVPEDLTVWKWPNHPRYGQRSGQLNQHFLDPNIFVDAFIKRLEPHHAKVGPLIFEFGTLPKTTFKTVDKVLDRLDPFLAALPTGWRYAVEIRNKEYLGSAYFNCLSSHGVAHTLNAWTRMPELGEQAEMEGIHTADFTVVRALLTHGRGYEQSVDNFDPYDRIQEPNEAARKALGAIVERIRQREETAFLYINNRLEGNAPSTIEAVVNALGAGKSVRCRPRLAPMPGA
jgi:uncharacterized protein YecE (DUF72 family)